MTLQERSSSPRFMSPELTWVRCKEVQPIHSREYGCIIDTVRGDELAIVPREYVDGMFVRGLKVATARSFTAPPACLVTVGLSAFCFAIARVYSQRDAGRALTARPRRPAAVRPVAR